MHEARGSRGRRRRAGQEARAQQRGDAESRYARRVRLGDAASAMTPPAAAGTTHEGRREVGRESGGTCDQNGGVICVHASKHPRSSEGVQAVCARERQILRYVATSAQEATGQRARTLHDCAASQYVADVLHAATTAGGQVAAGCARTDGASSA